MTKSSRPKMTDTAHAHCAAIVVCESKETAISKTKENATKLTEKTVDSYYTEIEKETM